MTPLRPAVAQAIADLDAEHYAHRMGGCRVCFIDSKVWPCVTRQVADDLRAALTEQENEDGCAVVKADDLVHGDVLVRHQKPGNEPYWTRQRKAFGGQS